MERDGSCEVWAWLKAILFLRANPMQSCKNEVFKMCGWICESDIYFLSIICPSFYGVSRCNERGGGEGKRSRS